MDRSFHCNYCDESHPIAWRTREHVLLEALGNRSMVLLDTCGGWNNFFARSFETPLLGTTLFKELRALYVPGVRGVERPVDDGTVLRVVSSGAIEEGTIPQGRWVTQFEFPVTNTQTGEVFDVTVTLPEPICVEITGHKRHVQRMASRELDKTTNVIQRHIQRAMVDPTVDPDLHAQLARHDTGTIHIDAVTGIEAQRPLVRETVGRTLDANLEVLLKTMAKTAWCYAALRIGRPYIKCTGAQRILQVLKRHVPVQLCTHEQLPPIRTIACAAPVGDVGIWASRWSAAANIAARRAATDGAVKRALRHRKRDITHLFRRIHITADIPASLTDDPARHRHHSLRLYDGTLPTPPFTPRGPSATCTIVEICLFGMIKARVQVADTPSFRSFGDHIDFSIDAARSAAAQP